MQRNVTNQSDQRWDIQHGRSVCQIHVSTRGTHQSDTLRQCYIVEMSAMFWICLQCVRSSLNVMELSATCRNVLDNLWKDIYIYVKVNQLKSHHRHRYTCTQQKHTCVQQKLKKINISKDHEPTLDNRAYTMLRLALLSMPINILPTRTPSTHGLRASMAKGSTAIGEMELRGFGKGRNVARKDACESLRASWASEEVILE